MFSLKSSSTIILIILGFFVGAIVWMNYNSQVKLRNASIAQIQDYASIEANTLGHFFIDRSIDLEDLSANREILAYFENKALGMSREYGLWASLVGMSELFSRYVSQKQLEAIPVYTRIGFWDSCGEFLADNMGVDNPDSILPRDLAKFVNHGMDVPRILVTKQGNKSNIVLAMPFEKDGIFLGTVLAWVNTEDILPLLMDCSAFGESKSACFLTMGPTFLARFHDIPPRLAKDVEKGVFTDTDRVLERKYSFSTGQEQEYLVSASPIPQTPFTFIKLVPLREVLGPLNPWQLLLSMLTLAVVVLGGTFISLRTSARNLLLSNRVTEAEDQAKIIEEKNRQLENEVGAKQAAQLELQALNENLERIIRESTAELREQTHNLEQEVAERKKVEDALRTIFNNTNDAIVIHDVSGEILDVNQKMLEMYRVEREQALKLSIANDLSAEGNPVDKLPEYWGQVVSGEQVELDWKGKRTDGDLFDARVVLQKIEFEGNPVVIASIHDISEEKRIMEQQVEYHELLNTIFKGIGAAIFIFDPVEGIMVDCNSVGEELLSISREDILNKSCEKKYLIKASRERDLLCPEWQDQDSYDEGVLIMENGTKVPISLQVFEIYFGGKSHLVEVIFDVTERKNLERKLSIAQKLESIGLLASGIAHEINTPIQYVGDSINFLKDAFEDLNAILSDYAETVEKLPEKEQELFKDIEEEKEDLDLEFTATEIPGACDRALEGVKRVADIVLAMKNFSHPGEEEFKAVDINKAIENTITVARNEWKYAAELKTDLEPNLPLVYCLPGGINQVLLNMIVNAAHAISDHNEKNEKGVITITTTQIEDQVEISIQDTGCGISPENIQKVFDPFFTTKEVGKGTGQGLAIAHDIIVDKHQGNITLDSEVGVGTTFTLKLPIRGDA